MDSTTALYTLTEVIRIAALALAVGFIAGFTARVLYSAYMLRIRYKDRIVPDFDYMSVLRLALGLIVFTIFIFMTIFMPGQISDTLALMALGFFGSTQGSAVADLILTAIKNAGNKNDRND